MPSISDAESSLSEEAVDTVAFLPEERSLGEQCHWSCFVLAGLAGVSFLRSRVPQRGHAGVEYSYVSLLFCRDE